MCLNDTVRIIITENRVSVRYRYINPNAVKSMESEGFLRRVKDYIRRDSFRNEDIRNETFIHYSISNKMYEDKSNCREHIHRRANNRIPKSIHEYFPRKGSWTATEEKEI